MCVAAGAYVVFLLLEDVIISYYSTDAASHEQGLNIANIKSAYGVYQKDISKSLEKVKRSNVRRKVRYLFSTSSRTSEKPHKNFQGERVTQNQYEIMNMLWRKPKIFVKQDDIYSTTPHYGDNISKRTSKRFKKDNLIKLSVPTLPSKTTTTSSIEFYYFEDTNVKEESCVEPNCKPKLDKTIDSKAKLMLQPSLLVFHLKGTAKPQHIKLTTLHSNESLFINEQAIISDIWLNKPQKVTQAKAKLNLSLKKYLLSDKKYFVDNAPVAQIIKSLVKLKNVTVYTDNNSNTDKHVLESSTFYDKIKFFEIHDHNTKTPNIRTKTSKINNDNNKHVDNYKKIQLEDVDEGSHDHLQAKHSKKHIVDNYRTNEKNKETKGFGKDVILKTQVNETSHATKENLNKPAQRDHDNVLPFMNKTARWSEYPFAAVYIYELSQVHCDAASITAHWLVASGSCLSRVSKIPDGEGRSAFVAYCGEQWWQPERVAYVKYSVVHPWYHHRDKTRRHLYNIGLIQVVNSMMSACTGWAPVTLMSHQFVADPQGSEALALGWGLDRYDTRYGATDLPKIPLMLYKGLVYFDSCPGNVGYSKAKRLDGGGVRNVVCLSLPPYSGEETDPVHGGLLVVGEKLIALYLQEERRPRGDQSAQYTGIWRLIPWIMDVAKEPEEFIFEM